MAVANGLGYRAGVDMGEGEGPIGYDINAGGGSGGGRTGEGNGCPYGGGAGYSTDGETHSGGASGAGGRAYGDAKLQRFLLGAGGGGGGEHTLQGGSYEGCGTGGRGGGSIFILGQTLNFSGSITANGVNGGSNTGGGAGGSIRIEAYQTIQLNLSAAGNTNNVDGANGRVAVYRIDQAGSIASSPAAYLGTVGEVDPTPTPYVPTPINLTPTPNWGTGSDGDLTVATATTFNISQDNSNSHICYTGGDGVSYSVLQLTNSWAKLGSAPTDQCLQVGDEILLISIKGTTSNHANVGNYEFLKVGGVVGDMVYFTTAKTKYYGDNLDDDSNVGSNQLVAIYRVPNYRNVTIDGTMTTDAWSGKDGIIVFRVSNKLEGAGSISLNGKGFAGGTDMGEGQGPAGYDINVGSGAGGGRTASGSGCPHGGGAGYLVNGQTYGGGRDGAGGLAYGLAQLDQVYFGAGGGGAGEHTFPDGSTEGCGTGGRGGGMLLVVGNTLSFTSLTISASGVNADANAGGGAGGSVRLEGNTVSLGTVTLGGGTRASSGRIAVYYQSTFSGSYSPIYLQKGDTPDSLFSADSEAGILTSTPYWNSSVGSLTISDSADYAGLLGLEVPVADNNSLYAQNDLPTAEPEYRARFYMDPNSLSMDANDVLDVFTGSNNSVDELRVQVRKGPLPIRDQTDPLFWYTGSWSKVNM